MGAWPRRSATLPRTRKACSSRLTFRKSPKTSRRATASCPPTSKRSRRPTGYVLADRAESGLGRCGLRSCGARDSHAPSDVVEGIAATTAVPVRSVCGRAVRDDCVQGAGARGRPQRRPHLCALGPVRTHAFASPAVALAPLHRPRLAGCVVSLGRVARPRRGIVGRARATGTKSRTRCSSSLRLMTRRPPPRLACLGATPAAAEPLYSPEQQDMTLFLPAAP